MSDAGSSSSAPLATLRRFVRPAPVIERCELCSAALAPLHTHLLERASRQLRCVCDACAVLFDGQQGGKYRRVRPCVQRLDELEIDDLQWNALNLPINLAFFVRDKSADRVSAVYPSPGGPVESEVALDVWESLVGECAPLHKLAPEVEALLVHRLGQSRSYYRVSIDQCYRLIGLIRTHWRGLSGGAQVWKAVAEFFADLDKHGSAATAGRAPH